MWPQTQQLRPKGCSAAQRGDQLLHLPALCFRVAAGDDRPQSTLSERSNLLWFAESKERVADSFRQAQEVHDLRHTRTGKTPSFRDVGPVQFGVGHQHLLPLKGQADRMLRRVICEHGFGGRGAQCVNSGNRERERMGDIGLGAPA